MKKYQRSNFREKIDALIALWISKTNYACHLLDITNRMRKLDQWVKFIFRWEIWKLNSTFETRSRSRFSWPLHFYCSIAEFTFLKQRKWTQLRKEIKSQTAKKSIWAKTNIMKKMIATYMRGENVHRLIKSLENYFMGRFQKNFSFLWKKVSIFSTICNYSVFILIFSQNSYSWLREWRSIILKLTPPFL